MLLKHVIKVGHFKPQYPVYTDSPIQQQQQQQQQQQKLQTNNII